VNVHVKVPEETLHLVEAQSRSYRDISCNFEVSTPRLILREVAFVFITSRAVIERRGDVSGTFTFTFTCTST
jgi:hypothetical protein